MTADEIKIYASVMTETLAMMHWIGEMDGNDIEFVLAPPKLDSNDKNSKEITTGSFPPRLKVDSDALGNHSMWILDFDLCRRMMMDSNGVEQAAAAFWRNDPYYPRPLKDSDINSSLRFVFKEHYLRTTEACIEIAYAVCEPQKAERQRALPTQVISLIEQGGHSRVQTYI